MRRKTPIFYSALMLTGVNLLLRFVGTSFQVYLSGRIGPAGIGLLQLVLSVGGLAMTAGIAGIRTATMYLTAAELGRRHRENVTWVLSGCITYSLICSCMLSLGIMYFAPMIAEGWIGEAATVGAIRLFAGFLPFCCLSAVMTGYFTAANRIGTLAAVEVAEQVCSMGTTMALLSCWAGSDPIRACMAVVMGSGISTCFTLLCLLYLRLREHAPTGPPISVGRKLLHTAVPLALADDLKVGISTGENLMVPRQLGLYPGTVNPLAEFGMICGMVFPVLMFPAAIVYGLTELLIPELARCAAAGSRTRIRYLVGRSLHVVLLYGCICSGLLFLFAPELCELLYADTDAGMHLRVYALLAPMLYSDAITDAMTKGLGQQTACVRYNILTSAMDVGLLFLLLPRFGLKGYFFSFLVTHLLNFTLSLTRLLKTSKRRISIKVPVLALLSTAGAVMAASLVENALFRGISFLLIWGSLLFLLGVLSKQDIVWMKTLLKKK